MMHKLYISNKFQENDDHVILKGQYAPEGEQSEPVEIHLPFETVSEILEIIDIKRTWPSTTVN